METMHLLCETEDSLQKIVRGKVCSVEGDGQLWVSFSKKNTRAIACDLLQRSDQEKVRFLKGDEVLVWLSEVEGERAVVLGRIGPSRAPVAQQQETPDELVIEAKKNLTFKCGDGSITLRKDGKILIKGKDLVSRAKRMNRIKGGSVAIN